MCAHPVVGSITSWMKSSRLRLLTPGTHAMPRLQMSPTCIGVLPVTLLTDQVALPGGSVRLLLRAAHRRDGIEVCVEGEVGVADVVEGERHKRGRGVMPGACVERELRRPRRAVVVGVGDPERVERLVLAEVAAAGVLGGVRRDP